MTKEFEAWRESQGQPVDAEPRSPFNTGRASPGSQNALREASFAAEDHPMTEPESQAEALDEKALRSCPFCGCDLYRKKGKHNPAAYCITKNCYGSKMPVVNLDVPEDVAAWNRRASLPEAPAVPGVKALEKAWDDFCDANPDGLTSPEDLPDHALMTRAQFVQYASAALQSSPPVKAEDPRWQRLRDLFGLDGWHDGQFHGLPSQDQIVTHIEHVANERARLMFEATSVSPVKAAAVDGAISLRDPMVILAGIKQFGLAPDGSDLRDLEAALASRPAAADAGVREALRDAKAYIKRGYVNSDGAAVIEKIDAALASQVVERAAAAREALREATETELQEIADGAYGDNPLTRGLARDELAKRGRE